jgi:hypothetical protein
MANFQLKIAKLKVGDNDIKTTGTGIYLKKMFQTPVTEPSVNNRKNPFKNRSLNF